MNKELLASFLKNELNIEPEESLLSKFEKYEKLLLEWNEKFNLTAITDESGITEKHFIDSLYAMKYEDFSNKCVCDAGTGAGFPGIPLAILNPSTSFILVDSNGKKCKFLQEVATELELVNVQVTKSRVEELNFRETFDFVTARAVTSLNVLIELTVPFLKVNGSLLAYKLGEDEKEIAEAKRALKLLESKVTKNEKYELPISKAKHSFVEVRKCDKTKNKYPRDFAIISAKPL